MKPLFFLPLLFAVSLTTAQEAIPPEDWFEVVSAVRDEMQDATDFSGITIPILHSKKLEKRWGKPRMMKSPGGGYYLQYHDTDPESPFEYVEIIGVPEVLPPLASAPPEMVADIVNGELGEIAKPQEWKTLTAKWKGPGGKLEKALRYFRRSSGGGADGPQDMSDAFSLTVNGKTGYYLVIIESITDATEKRLKSLDITD